MEMLRELQNGEFEPTIELLAASIVDSLYPMIVNSIAKTIEKELFAKPRNCEAITDQLKTQKDTKRKHQKLDSLFIDSVSEPGMYADGGNLWLQVSKWGTKSWVFRYTLNGKRRQMGLGSNDTVGIAIARMKASHARMKLVDGIDPLAETK